MGTPENFQVGQEVTFADAYGVNIIVGIKGNTATTFEKNTGTTYKKRLSSLRAYKQQKAYWNEQELVNPKYKHGDTVFSALSGDGDGCKMVWDSVQNKCVSKDKLTKI